MTFEVAFAYFPMVSRGVGVYCVTNCITKCLFMMMVITVMEVLVYSLKLVKTWSSDGQIVIFK